jgi:XisH protein
MPAKDIIHDAVKTALIKDGWVITHDPFIIRLGEIRVFADLGAELPIAAERAGRKIAVEIKSFVGASLVSELEQAIGQYELYKVLLAEREPERILYLAVAETTWINVFERPAVRVIVERLALNIVVVRVDKLEVAHWTI